jgi:hypothetical protein
MNTAMYLWAASPPAPSSYFSRPSYLSPPLLPGSPPVASPPASEHGFCHLTPPPTSQQHGCWMDRRHPRPSGHHGLALASTTSGLAGGRLLPHRLSVSGRRASPPTLPPPPSGLRWQCAADGGLPALRFPASSGGCICKPCGQPGWLHSPLPRRCRHHRHLRSTRTRRLSCRAHRRLSCRAHRRLSCRAHCRHCHHCYHRFHHRYQWS